MPTATKIKTKKTINYIDDNGMTCSVDIDPGIQGVFQRVWLRITNFVAKHPKFFRAVAWLGFYAACGALGYSIGMGLGLVFAWLWVTSPTVYWILLVAMTYAAYRIVFGAIYSLAYS